MNIEAPKFSPTVTLGSILTMSVVVLGLVASYINQGRDVKEVRDDVAAQRVQLDKVTEIQNSRSALINHIGDIERQLVVIQAGTERNADRLNSLSVLEATINERFKRYEEILKDQEARARDVVQVLDAVREELRRRPQNESRLPALSNQRVTNTRGPVQ